MTTVGYGDIAPKTIIGQFLASVVMLMGYGIIAIPTGLVIHDLSKEKKTCIHCGFNRNCLDAKYCNNCGKEILNE